MGKLANISGRDAVKAFRSIPQHRELSVGTLRALIRHAGMSVEQFLELL